ncbi:MAG: ABC transporter ATP-binding protein/permease [Clostridia bacterium]|nr:ABC transporter ATP-binding protein/permease [Clostridia bacterium]
MKLITDYLSKFKLKMIVVILCLIGEAAMCLVSPYLIGNLVNIGIQQQGFEDSCPVIISRNAFALFEEIIPNEKCTELNGLYIKSRQTPDYLDKKYTSDRECYYIRENADISKAKEIYQNAVLSALSAIRGVEGFDSYDYDTLAKEISLTSLYVYSGSVYLTEQQKSDYYKTAEKTGTAVKMQAASMLLPYVYEDAAVDCETIQNSYMFRIMAEIIGVTILQFAFAMISSKCISVISSQTEKNMRLDLLRHTAKFTDKELKSFPPESLAYVTTSGVGQIGMTLNYGVKMLIYAPIIAIFGSIITFMRSAAFGSLILLGAVLIILSIIIIFRCTAKKYYYMQEQYEKYVKSVSVNLKQLLTLRTSNAQKSEEAKVSILSKDIYKNESFVMKAVLIALSSINLVTNIVTAFAIAIGGENMLSSELTAGNIITYLQYTIITISAFMMIGAMIVFAPKALVAIKDIGKIYSLVPEADNFGDVPSPVSVSDRIEFNNVELFDGSPKFSFRIEPNKVTIITGRTGTGKSTLAKCLLRQNKPLSGDISIDGREITVFDNSYPGRLVSFAESTPVLFSRSIRSNMLLHGAPNDDSILLNALDKAECGFIVADADDLDTVLENSGEKFSGGQRSRLSIAGAVAKQAGVYIFDDCLTSVDENVRQKIFDNLCALKENAAVVIVAQNIIGMEKADSIVMLTDEGAIQGSFDELTEKSADFRSFTGRRV